MNIPDNIAAACRPLFETVPFGSAMSRLVGAYPAHTEMVTSIASAPILANKPELIAALWLYVDDLDRSHVVSQSIESATGSYWHGIMHRREGDFSNSHYWMRRAERHPILVEQPDLAPRKLVDDVAAARGRDLPELVARQRAEWLALFEWCANYTNG